MISIRKFALSSFVLAFIVHRHHVLAESEKGGVKFKIASSERDEVAEAVVREPRETYFARILEENPKHDSVATHAADMSSSSESVEETSQLPVVLSGSSSSSSEEAMQHRLEEAVVMGSSSSTPDPDIPLSSPKPENEKLQVVTKLQTGQLVKQWDPKKGSNWYVHKNGQRVRGMGRAGKYVGGNEKRNVNSGGANSTSGGGGGHGGGKLPYNVVRAKPSDIVDPDSYNFFQFKPHNKLAWLWLSHGRRLGGRIDLLGNDRGDDGGLDPSDKYDWEFRRYDRACLYVEYKKQKSDAIIPDIPEELKRIVDVQNELLARRFLDWQFINKESHEAIALQDQGDKHPLHKTYKFLQLTMELFRDKICRNASSYAVAVAHSAPPGGVTRALTLGNSVDTKLLPKAFIEEIFRLFLTLRDITLSKNLPDFANQLDEDEVYKEVLEKCKAEEENINWFSHSCGDQILSNDFPNNFACTPLVDYDFNSKLYDPILDGMWLMFNAVHSYCFKQFQVNTRLWHKYSMIIANAFTHGMRQRWRASTAIPKFYVRLLGPDHEVHLETINRCRFATALRSDVTAILPRFDTLSPITFGKERMIHKDATAANPKP